MDDTHPGEQPYENSHLAAFVILNLIQDPVLALALLGPKSSLG